jgi:hypothetical protein
MGTPYREGQFFLLPIQRGAYAVGLIARAPARGGVLLGYFFGPRRSHAPDVDWLNARLPGQALMVCRFRDAALSRGEWTLLSVLPGFNRKAWPVPAFHRFDGSVTSVPGNDAVQDWRVEYGDDNLILPLAETPAHGPDLKLADDVACDPGLLIREVGQRIMEMVPTVDDATHL